MVLLNSTTWSCALTRKTNLTYFEAIESEQNAERELGDFPVHLETPILFIVHKLTNRGRFEELVNDIYQIMRDRFFNTEEVAYSEKSRKYVARIVASFHSVKKEEEAEEGEGEQKPSCSDVKDPIMPAADQYLYTVEILDSYVAPEERIRNNITFDRLFRSKNIGSRQKIRLFLKNSCHLPTTGDRYTVKDKYMEHLEHLTWSDVMSGPEPICPQTPVLQRGRIPNTLKPGYTEPEKKEKRRKREEKDPNALPKPRGRPPKTPEQRALTQEQKKIRKRREAGREADECDLTSSGALTLSMPSTSCPVKKRPRKNSEKKKAKIIEQQEDLDFYFSEARRLGIDVTGLEGSGKLLSGKVVTEFKHKVKEEKENERENIKEERKRKIREKAAYNKKRDDLLCNDLKPMPKFPKLEIPTWMADEEFSDYIFVMQFFCAYKEILPLKEIRGHDEIHFSEIVLAMKCNDPQNSPFADLMKVLLTIRTDITDEEDGDEADINNRDELYLINAQNCDPVNPTHGDSIRDSSDLHLKIRKIHGKSVRHLPVDWMTLTEVIRLIFETSGYYTGLATHRHRLYARGNFHGYEDPAFEFRTMRPDIMDKLRSQTVFDLEPSERLEITKTIIYQLLTYSKFRSHIEKQQNDMFELKKEQKKLKSWDVGQEAEANAARLLFEMTPSLSNGATMNGENALVKRFKSHIKAHNEGRRFDKEELDTILLDAVPYSSLDLDEIITARELQKAEYKQIMESLISKIFEIHCNIGDIRLGTDRVYRRYIVLRNLSAIIVESPTLAEPVIDCEEASTIDEPNVYEENDFHESFICSGNGSNCPVHGPDARVRRARWCYVENENQLEQLVKSLNSRGIRENDLLEEINEFHSELVSILKETEQMKEDDEWKEQLLTDIADPADTYNIDWDTEIRDLLLDFEEKIEQGQMGSIEKIFSISRWAWRENLKESGDVCILLKESIKIYNEELVDTNDMTEYSDVKKLAVAFLMIIRCISFKFIKTPFLSPNRDEHGNAKPSELFVRWQRALLQCESLSALSLFISIIESSIKWDKSRLQGKCRACRRKAAAHELVLCSECDTCYHLKCAKLKTDADAPLDWLCSTCRAYHRKEENEAKRRNRVDTTLGETDDEIGINNMSIADESGFQADNGECSSNGGATQNVAPETMKTLSGRSVKKVRYSSVHEGVSPKSRKSNGATSSVVTPTIPSERPIRSASLRVFEINQENEFSDDDDGELTDEENGNEIASSKKRKSTTTTPKATSIASEAVRIALQNTKEKMSAIETLLKETMRQECSWPFLQPVDSKEVPDYYDVIKRPMDLRTMMNKIKQRVYNSPDEVRNDFQLILTNCETYNETDSEIYQLSQELSEFAASRLDAIIHSQ
uniref:Histone acetyltransferase n=1 Tax=Caenorhabditis japonica TaxID=281687 RepID=A0A8R1DWP1_CAEJA